LCPSWDWGWRAKSFLVLHFISRWLDRAIVRLIEGFGRVMRRDERKDAHSAARQGAGCSFRYTQGLVYLWKSVDSEGDVLDMLVHTKRNKAAALKLMRKPLKKYGFLQEAMVTDDLRSYSAAARVSG
jgi:transposase-like protein